MVKAMKEMGMRWLNGITDSVDLNLSKLRETEMDGGAWVLFNAAACEVAESDMT